MSDSNAEVIPGTDTADDSMATGDDGSTDVAALDTPISRATIDQLPLEAIDAWLASMRDRRLHVVRKLTELREVKDARKKDEVFGKYQRLYARVKTKMATIDEAILSVEANVGKLRMMRMEIDDDPD